MTERQLAVLNSLVTFAAENIPGGLGEDEREVARIVGEWVISGKDLDPRLRQIFDEASAALSCDAGELIFLIREIEKEAAGQSAPIGHKTHDYKFVNWTHDDSVQTCADKYAERGWRVISLSEYSLVLERPVGVTHPDD